MMAATPTVILQDDFSGSSGAWIAADWTIAGGQARTTSPGISSTLLSAQSYTSTRFTIEARMTIGQGQGPSGADGFGLVFCQAGEDRYHLSWHPGGAFVLEREGHDGVTLLAQTTLELGNRTSSWRVARDGMNGAIQVYVDTGNGFPAAPQLQGFDRALQALGVFGLLDTSEDAWPLACDALVATTIVAAPLPTVARLVLIDADTEQPVPGVPPLADGVELNLYALPAHLTIRADTVPVTVGSVRFDLDGTLHMENQLPYALAGDAAGGTDYLPWTPTLGSHRLTVWPSTQTNGGGTSGVPQAIRFTVINLFTRLQVSFRPHGVLQTPGYVDDFGDVFGPRTGRLAYGWNQNNFETRERVVNGTSFTFDHMQKPSDPNATWEIAVPNGVYHVNVTCGDIAYTDSRYRIAAEGLPLTWDTGATYGVPDVNHAFFFAQMDVTVRDGRLTIGNAPGAVNNKLVSVWVEQIMPLGDG